MSVESNNVCCYVQTSEDAATVADLVTGSPTAPSWRPSRTSKLPTSAAETTLPATQLIIKSPVASYCLVRFTILSYWQGS